MSGTGGRCLGAPGGVLVRTGALWSVSWCVRGCLGASGGPLVVTMDCLGASWGPVFTVCLPYARPLFPYVHNVAVAWRLHAVSWRVLGASVRNDGVSAFVLGVNGKVVGWPQGVRRCHRRAMFQPCRCAKMSRCVRGARRNAVVLARQLCHCCHRPDAQSEQRAEPLLRGRFPMDGQADPMKATSR